MEQIELVIKMPKEYYDLLMSGRFYLCGARGNGKTVTSEVMKSICTGIVLTKGHGALKDEKDLITKIELNYRNSPKPIYVEAVKDMIRTTVPVIKADKERAEE